MDRFSPENNIIRFAVIFVPYGWFTKVELTKDSEIHQIRKDAGIEQLSLKLAYMYPFRYNYAS